jgi:hypothetical protein
LQKHHLFFQFSIFLFEGRVLKQVKVIIIPIVHFFPRIPDDVFKVGLIRVVYFEGQLDIRVAMVKEPDKAAGALEEAGDAV